MSSVERVKEICKERKIPISKLEKDLGYGNGYLSQLKKGKLPDDRLYQIAKYLNVDPAYLSSGVKLNISESSFANLMYTMISEDLDSILPSDAELNLIAKYRKASDRDKQLIDSILSVYAGDEP